MKFSGYIVGTDPGPIAPEVLGLIPADRGPVVDGEIREGDRSISGVENIEMRNNLIVVGPPSPIRYRQILSF